MSADCSTAWKPTLTQIVRDHGRVKAKCIRPVLDRDQGSTYMIGSRASETYFRAYEKPEQLMAEGLAHKSMRVFFDRWVRCELEAKPQKDNRHAAATFEPREYFGLSRMGRAIASELLTQVVDRTGATDYKKLTTKARRRLPQAILAFIARVERGHGIMGRNGTGNKGLGPGDGPRREADAAKVRCRYSGTRLKVPAHSRVNTEPRLQHATRDGNMPGLATSPRSTGGRE
uniref:P.cepacia plasmid PPC1 DNA n=1 Tax=Burkholderia cepacia TaxID=292 RepID=Q51650_BURCE|nr:unnamed protein product [Burkholderia cepacia]